MAAQRRRGAGTAGAVPPHGFGDLRIVFRYESYRVSEVSEDSGAWDEDRMIARARARRSRGRASTGVPGFRISERNLN